MPRGVFIHINKSYEDLWMYYTYQRGLSALLVSTDRAILRSLKV